MNKRSHSLRRVTILLVIFLFALPLSAIAQEITSDEGDESVANCGPSASALAAEIGISCSDLIDLQSDGAGLGEIMQAWYLAQNLENYEGDWRALLEMKQEGTGWGQFKMAYRLADENTTTEQLLDLKRSGLGWGQIKQAQALANLELGYTFEQALDMLGDGTGWGELRDQLGLPPGPPPWAGGNMNGQGHGKPDWANGKKGPPSTK